MIDCYGLLFFRLHELLRMLEAAEHETHTSDPEVRGLPAEKLETLRQYRPVLEEVGLQTSLLYLDRILENWDSGSYEDLDPVFKYAIRLSLTAFGTRMSERFEKAHRQQGNVYCGLGLRRLG